MDNGSSCVVVRTSGYLNLYKWCRKGKYCQYIIYYTCKSCSNGKEDLIGTGRNGIMVLIIPHVIISTITRTNQKNL